MFENKNYRRDILIILLLLFVPIILFWKVISTDILLYQGDGIGYMAVKDYIKNVLSAGEFPLWNKLNATGIPFAADVQSAVFYPINVIVLIFPVYVGFKLYFTIHLSLAAIGMYYYIKRISKNIYISLASGLVIMFSNILIIRFNHINTMASIAWLPFMLLITDKLVEYKKAKYAIILGTLMSLQFFAGFPQTALYSDIFLFCYYLSFNLHYKRKFTELVKEIAIFVGSYFGLIAVQLFPLAQLIVFTKRSDMTYNFFIGGSQSWRMLIQMIYPAFWGAGSSNLNIGVEFPTDIYIGIIPLLLCIYGIRYYFNDFRVKVCLYTMIVSFAYTCCGELPFLAKIIYHIPILNSFRVPSRILYVAIISCLILAFYSLFLLIYNKDYKRYIRSSLVVFTFSLIFAFFIHFMGSPIFNVFSETYKAYYMNNWLYLISLVIMLLNVFIVYFLFICSRFNIKKYFTNIFCISIAIITIIDVY